jgi:hypothetical protein
LPNYLAWTDADLANIERALKRYRTMGLEASFDGARAREGVVTLSQVDPRTPDASIVTLEIHKFGRSDHPERMHWVVQLQSIGGRDNVQKQHGCISAGSLVFAIAKAELDIESGFASTDTFDLAANAYWLK